MDLRDRLKQLGVTRGPGATRPPESKAPAARPSRPGTRRARLEDLVPGTVLDTEHGPCYLIDHMHPAEHDHGGVPLRGFLDLHVHVGLIAEIARDPGLAASDLTRAVFLDTETTGLGVMAGTLVFLVGLGMFEPAAEGGQEFHVRQFFLRDPDEELAMLAAIADVAAGRPLVTFNGRAFDLPLLDNRYILARRRNPLSGAPHLDLLPPSRRLWRERLGSCALSALEENVLGVVRDQINVPGWQIPQLYADYLRGGDARQMVGVLYHNRIDVLSMVSLAARLCQAYADPAAPGTHARDALSLAHWYDQHRRAPEALRAYGAAAEADDPAVQAEALRGWGYLLRRLERREEAVPLWMRLAEMAGDDIAAYVELAKHYEWHAGDPARASEWTRMALAHAQAMPRGPQRTGTESELRHRLERLERKLAARSRTS